jgi:hypothetical protein
MTDPRTACALTVLNQLYSTMPAAHALQLPVVLKGLSAIPDAIPDASTKLLRFVSDDIHQYPIDEGLFMCCTSEGVFMCCHAETRFRAGPPGRRGEDTVITTWTRSESYKSYASEAGTRARASAPPCKIPSFFGSYTAFNYALDTHQVAWLQFNLRDRRHRFRCCFCSELQ